MVPFLVNIKINTCNIYKSEEGITLDLRLVGLNYKNMGDENLI
jgi:hypothetical protein